MCSFSFSRSRHSKTIKNVTNSTRTINAKLIALLDNGNVTQKVAQTGCPKFSFFLKKLKKTVAFQMPKTRNFFS